RFRRFYDPAAHHFDEPRQQLGSTETPFPATRLRNATRESRNGVSISDSQFPILSSRDGPIPWAALDEVLQGGIESFGGHARLILSILMERHPQHDPFARRDFRDAVFDRLQAVRPADGYEAVAGAEQEAVAESRGELAAACLRPFVA